MMSKIQETIKTASEEAKNANGGTKTVKTLSDNYGTGRFDIKKSKLNGKT